jgi:alcohol dehydrogenase
LKALVYDAFEALPEVRDVEEPTPENHGVIIRVEATGVCRSDWHGWMGHDRNIALPHVPGHELAGIIEAVGKDVKRWNVGDRVTVPFVGGCGTCPQCNAGQQQVCDAQSQPGFTHWGSFAEFVSIHNADVNLVSLPESMNFATAASLGCRFVTSFRAVVDQGKVKAGDWVAVHGCGGVGLSAIMIASAVGANVIGIDITEDKLKLAESLGAVASVNAATVENVAKAVREISNGGVHVSLDALGSPATCYNSISNLRKRGKHIQVGLMLGEHRSPQIPMARVIAHELEIIGSHGIQAYRYVPVFEMIKMGKLAPEKLIGNTITLSESIEALTGIDSNDSPGVTVITQFNA